MATASSILNRLISCRGGALSPYFISGFSRCFSTSNQYVGITLLWKPRSSGNLSIGGLSARHEGIISLLGVACGGFLAGLCYRFSAGIVFLLIAILMSVVFAAALQYRQAYADPSGFSCPGVPAVPIISIFFNMFLFAQLHWEAWVRFIVVSIFAIGIYAAYGQYHATSPDCINSSIDHAMPAEDSQ